MDKKFLSVVAILILAIIILAICMFTKEADGNKGNQSGSVETSTSQSGSLNYSSSQESLEEKIYSSSSDLSGSTY